MRAYGCGVHEGQRLHHHRDTVHLTGQFTGARRGNRVDDVQKLLASNSMRRAHQRPGCQNGGHSRGDGGDDRR